MPSTDPVAQVLQSPAPRRTRAQFYSWVIVAVFLGCRPPAAPPPAPPPTQEEQFQNLLSKFLQAEFTDGRFSVPNEFAAGELQGLGARVTGIELDKTATGQLLPKPYVQICVADFEHQSMLCTEEMVTNIITRIKTNGFMATMTNAGITPFIEVDTCWVTNRMTAGVTLTNSSYFPRGIKWLSNFCHSNGCDLALAMYYTNGWAPGVTVGGGNPYEKISPTFPGAIYMTIDSADKDVWWIYEQGVDMLRIQDMATYNDYVETAVRSIGYAALNPNKLPSSPATRYPWNQWQMSYHTNNRPLALSMLIGAWPPPSEAFQVINMIGSDADPRFPITPRWVYTNMVPLTSPGHFVELDFYQTFYLDSQNPDTFKNTFSKLAMFSASVHLGPSPTNVQPFAAWLNNDNTALSLLTNATFYTIQQDVGDQPSFHVQRIFDNGSSTGTSPSALESKRPRRPRRRDGGRAKSGKVSSALAVRLDGQIL